MPTPPRSEDVRAVPELCRCSSAFFKTQAGKHTTTCPSTAPASDHRGAGARNQHRGCTTQHPSRLLPAKLLPAKLVSEFAARVSSVMGLEGGQLPKRSAAMYGMMASLPNKGDLNEIVLDLLDQLTQPEERKDPS